MEVALASANTKVLHAVDMLRIDYHNEACQRKNRANSWNDCHSRVEVPRQQAQKKICWDFVFRARASRISSLASGRGGPRYCGGQQAAKRIKKRAGLPAPRLPYCLLWLLDWPLGGYLNKCDGPVRCARAWAAATLFQVAVVI
jgi:hypothetical protein